MLATARLPKSYWFWAIRESVGQMNMIPVWSSKDDVDASKFVPYPNDLDKQDDAGFSAAYTYLYFNEDDCNLPSERVTGNSSMSCDETLKFNDNGSTVPNPSL